MKGSEPAVGWNLAVQAQKHCDIYVLTRTANRAAIESYERQHGKSGVVWNYYDLPKKLFFWKKKSRGVLLYYLSWQLGAASVCNKLHKEFLFDVVHHLTFGSLFLPTFLHRIDATFLWGPIGGAALDHNEFSNHFSTRGKIFECLRHILIRSGITRLLHGGTLRKARCILAVSEESIRVLRRHDRKFILFSQVGIGDADLRLLLQVPVAPAGRRSVIMVGRLEHWKGIGLGIAAFARYSARHQDATLTVIGDGPERSFLEKCAKKSGVRDRVRFTGTVSRESYFRFISDSNVLLFPSSHEPGAYVITENMAAGRPVICTRYGEPATLVPENCGILVSPSEDRSMVVRFASALEQVLENPTGAASMGQSGREWVLQHHRWEDKGRDLTAIYEECCRLPVGGFSAIRQ